MRTAEVELEFLNRSELHQAAELSNAIKKPGKCLGGGRAGRSG